jgi:hypothetical protein
LIAISHALAAQPPRHSVGLLVRLVQRHQLGRRHAVARNHDHLARLGPLEQVRKVGLCGVDVDGCGGSFHDLLQLGSTQHTQQADLVNP